MDEPRGVALPGQRDLGVAVAPPTMRGRYAVVMRMRDYTGTMRALKVGPVASATHATSTAW
jgi:hypothetical protein